VSALEAGPRSADPAAVRSTFGAGHHEPYDNALRTRSGTLHLHEISAGAAQSLHKPAYIDLSRFLEPADADDREVIRGIRGPVLDIGCGPGRMVKAAILAGHLALGIDVSEAAVSIAREHGLPALCRSVFQPLPAEGTWGTAMLIDGNIGIGGDPQLLLVRCAELVPGDGYGRIVVETHANDERNRIFDAVVEDDRGGRSLPFPWAEVGRMPLRSYAASAGLQLVREWSYASRRFAEYTRP
jgi:SAM-dependent methyltransferase